MPLQGIADGRHGHFIQRASGLFAIAGNERHTAAGIKQSGNRFHLALRNILFVGNTFAIRILHMKAPEKNICIKL